ncbi:hypothetical protein [Pyxidicoccus xibeiensis]|uniref:hypothetical protein n=1 Tax=Pyxidicoccus xibeiensis TaxID=2906759 RepID=UPI0020A704FD|nr:hypothetical protein [Pyxidicoccus xibeiensis]MCP3139691.1 hypothetical protein [Pyxidicoccus xibeiensis]
MNKPMMVGLLVLLGVGVCFGVAWGSSKECSACDAYYADICKAKCGGEERCVDRCAALWWEKCSFSCVWSSGGAFLPDSPPGQ